MYCAARIRSLIREFPECGGIPSDSSRFGTRVVFPIELEELWWTRFFICGGSQAGWGRQCGGGS